MNYNKQDLATIAEQDLILDCVNRIIDKADELGYDRDEFIKCVTATLHVMAEISTFKGYKHD